MLFDVVAIVASCVRVTSLLVQSMALLQNCCTKQVRLVCECVPVTAIFTLPASLSIVDVWSCEDN